ncbi:hypothetical protein LTS18_010575 [Coniosporium uncinatum]|uniref:Uncharacterized protein n=1 Tax=Coniosporium uncinatum TaxID=93489 RepID=A0ACC3DKY8_9PEZI|nr:hypothetical protein LTS18_010575 [Coniosporium uncinatum]
MSPLRNVSLPLDASQQFLQRSTRQTKTSQVQSFEFDDFFEINRDAHNSYLNAKARDPAAAYLPAGMDWTNAPSTDTPPSSTIKAARTPAATDSRGDKVSRSSLMSAIFSNTDQPANTASNQQTPLPPLPQSASNLSTNGGNDPLLAAMELEPSSPELDNAMLGVGAEGVNWGIWDDMVQQFGVEMDQSQDMNVNYGPAIGGFQTWY